MPKTITSSMSTASLSRRPRPLGAGRENVRASHGRGPRERRGDRVMGQKVNPIGLRLGINRTWDSRWFARKEYGNLLLDDLGLRRFLSQRLGQAGVSRVVIERAAKRTRIT